MFGIGAQELAVIAIVALLVFGPKRLPELARSLGKGLAEFRRASNDLRQGLSLEDDPPPRPAQPTPPPKPSVDSGHEDAADPSDLAHTIAPPSGATAAVSPGSASKSESESAIDPEPDPQSSAHDGPSKSGG